MSFEPPEGAPDQLATRALEIVVLREASPTDEKPEIADAFAQVDRLGGGIEEAQDLDVKPSIEPVPEILEPEPDHAESLPPPPPPAARTSRRAATTSSSGRGRDADRNHRAGAARGAETPGETRTGARASARAYSRALAGARGTSRHGGPDPRQP